jgi:hypothetical protein
MADWADEKVAELCPDIVLGHDRVNHSRTRHAIATALRELDARARAEARVAALEEAAKWHNDRATEIRAHGFDSRIDGDHARAARANNHASDAVSIRSLKTTPAEEPTK